MKRIAIHQMLLLTLLLTQAFQGCSGDAGDSDFDSAESYLDFAAGSGEDLETDLSPEDPSPFGEITPMDWRRLFQQADQPYLVVIGSVYCQPCLILEETVLAPYRSQPRQVPYYHFEIGDYPIRVNWLLDQPFWAQVQEATQSDFPITPTLLVMQGDDLLAFHPGLLDMEAFLDLAAPGDGE